MVYYFLYYFCIGNEFAGLGLLDRKRCCIVEDMGCGLCPPWGAAEIRAVI